MAGAAAAHPPYGLAVDRAGTIYFSDLETVWRIASDGRLVVFRPRVPDTHVHELALAPDGAIEGDQNCYDPATGRFSTGLWRRTAEGQERMLVPMTEDAPAGFGPWQDRQGNRYASAWPSNDDRRAMLTRRSPDGRALLVFAEGAPPERRPGVVASVGGMAFPADGSVIFADRNLLRRFDPAGRVSVLYRGLQGSSLRGLTVAPDGRVLAADMGRKVVLAVTADGQAEILYREDAAWLPTAVAVTSGRLLVLEANANHHETTDRVRVVEVNEGRSRVIAAPGAPQAVEASGAAPPEGARVYPWLPIIVLATAGAAVWALRRR